MYILKLTKDLLAQVNFHPGQGLQQQLGKQCLGHSTYIKRLSWWCLSKPKTCITIGKCPFPLPLSDSSATVFLSLGAPKKKMYVLHHCITKRRHCSLGQASFWVRSRYLKFIISFVGAFITISFILQWKITSMLQGWKKWCPLCADFIFNRKRGFRKPVKWKI